MKPESKTTATIPDQAADYHIASTADGILFPHLPDQVFPSAHLCSRNGDRDHRTSFQAVLCPDPTLPSRVTSDPRARVDA
jgi:hypothetical protein